MTTSANPPLPSFVNLRMLLAGDDPTAILHAALEEMLWQRGCEWRVMVPGVVTSFDAGPPQIATVQIAIQETIFQSLIPTGVNVDPLQMVPIHVYGAGGFLITLPITVGDECLLIFSDTCINRWRVEGAPTSGPVASQEERRRHDLSDGIAIFGLWSQTTARTINNYSTTSLQIRSLDGDTVIDIADDQITVSTDDGNEQFQLSSGKVTMTPDNGVTVLKVIPGQVDITAASGLWVNGVQVTVP